MPLLTELEMDVIVFYRYFAPTVLIAEQFHRAIAGLRNFSEGGGMPDPAHETLTPLSHRMGEGARRASEGSSISNLKSQI